MAAASRPIALIAHMVSIHAFVAPGVTVLTTPTAVYAAVGRIRGFVFVSSGVTPNAVAAAR